MKMLFLALICALSLTFPAHAAYEQELEAQLQTQELRESVPEELQDLVSGVNLFTGEGLQEAFSGLKKLAVEAVKEQIRSVWTPSMKVLLVVMVCSVAGAFLTGERGEFVLSLTGGVAIATLSLSQAQSIFQHGLQTIGRLYDFSSVLLPCLTGAAVLSGASISAGTKYTAAVLVMNGLLNLSNTLLIPMIGAYLSLSIGGQLLGQSILTGAAKLMQKGTRLALTGVVVAFTSYLSIAGLITSAGDAFAVRATRTALSATLPVVGRIISDTASTLVAGAGVLKGCIGAFGLVVILGLLITPVMGLGLRYLLFKAVGVLSELFPQQKLSGLISSIAGAFGLMLAVMGTGFVMLFLTLLSFMYLHGG